MAAPTETVRIDRYSKGVITRGVNPFSFPRDALAEAINLRLADGGLKCRKGMEQAGQIALVGNNIPLLNLKFDTSVTLDDTGRHTDLAVDPLGDTPVIDTSVFYEGIGSAKSTGFCGIVAPAHTDWWFGKGDPDRNWSISLIFKYDNWPAEIYLGWESAYSSDNSIRYTFSQVSNRIWWHADFEVGDMPDPTHLEGAGVNVAPIFAYGTWLKFELVRLNGYYKLYLGPAATYEADRVTLWSQQSDLALTPLPAEGSDLYFSFQGTDHLWVDDLLIVDGPNTLTYTSEIRGLWEVRFAASEAKYLLLQTAEGDLFVSKDQLPSSSLTWERIYQLGSGAGLCSPPAILSDRAILTEGINKEPVVFSGGLDAAGSDWASPKAVLLKRGSTSHYEDITQACCDQDLYNSAQIGGMLLDGEIVIICDVPQVKGFRFEMEVPNTGLSAGSADFTETIDFTDAADFSTFDCALSATPHWLQDSAATGHFEGATVTLTEGEAVTDEGGGNVGLVCVGSTITEGMIVEVRGSHANYNGTKTAQAGSSATKVIITATYAAHTVGTGETCNWRVPVGAFTHISPGVLVNFSDASINIISITDQGEADEEVTLETAHATGDVASITSIELSGSLLRLTSANAGQSEEVFAQTLTGTTSLAGYSLRVVVLGADLSSTGTSPVLTTKIGTPYGASCSHMSIVQQGTGASGSATPTEILTSGQHGWSGITGEEITHDAVEGFTIDTGQNYLVIYDMVYTTVPVTGGGQQTGISSAAWDAWRASEPAYADQYGNESVAHRDWRLSQPAQRYVPVYAPTYTTTVVTGCLTEGAGDGGFYWKAPSGTTATETWDTQTVSGFSLAAGHSLGIKSISAGTTASVIPTQAAVATTTNTSRLAIGHIEAIKQVVETGNALGIQWRAVSFDQLATLWVFKSGAWREVVRFSTVWQFREAAGTWAAAATNSMLGAWWEAAAISANQMSASELQAITEAQWSGTGGFIPHITTYLDFAWYAQVSTGAIPALTSFGVKYADTGTALMEGYQAGVFTQGDGWTDGTQTTAGVPLSGDGVISYNSGAFTADYGVISEVHGYAFRLRTQGTSALTAITKIRYQADCQPLATIAANIPDPPLSFIVVDASTGAQTDYATQMQDNISTELSIAPLPLEVADEICVTGLTGFNAIELTPLIPNGNAALFTATYWNGTSRQPLSINDGTLSNGKCCAVKGKIAFTLPDDFRDAIPYEGKSERGYNVFLKVTAALSATTSVSECRVYSVPKERPKYKHALVVQNRLALGNRPDQSAQWDIGRVMEPEGMCGTDSRVDGKRLDNQGPNQGGVIAGAGGAILGAVEAWGSLISFGANEMYQLLGNSPAEWFFGRVEAAGLIPINSQVVVKAPMSSNDGDRYALYLINEQGAFAISGLQADPNFGTSRVDELSEFCNYWKQDHDGYRLDLNHLYLACGVAWHQENQIKWSVPLILPGNTEQTTNNAIITWNRAMQGWEGIDIFPVGFASLCAAYTYNANAPGKLGPSILLGGSYDGKVYRLFNGDDDNGQPIEWSAKGWLSSGRIVKRVSDLKLFGRTTTDPVEFKLSRDGDQTEDTNQTKEFTELIDPQNKDFWMKKRRPNLSGEVFRYQFSGSGPAEIMGIEFGLEVERDEFA